ncbi:MAG: hypothetical protein E5V25_13890 [Mesorhizobium sp.]|nr:MAG: hypothetical protein E5V25_13890 [Mesorhizobium sp.]
MAKGWTLQSLIDGKMRLTAFCHNPKCHHNETLDLDAIKAKLGPDAPAMSDDLIPKLKCARCGGKQVGLTYTPDYDEMKRVNVNAYRKAREGR